MQLVKIYIMEQLWIWANIPDVLLSQKQKQKPSSKTTGILWFQVCKQKCGALCTEKVAGNIPRYFFVEEIQLTSNFSLLSASELLCVAFSRNLKKEKERKWVSWLALCVGERWVGLNIWQLEEDGCVSDSDGVYAGTMTHVWVSLGFCFWQGAGGRRSCPQQGGGQ